MIGEEESDVHATDAVNSKDGKHLFRLGSG